MRMRNMLVVPAIGLAAAICASPMVAYAQDSSARDAAIAKCMKLALAEYPDVNVVNIRNRSDRYKACMADAGFRP